MPSNKNKMHDACNEISYNIKILSNLTGFIYIKRTFNGWVDWFNLSSKKLIFDKESYWYNYANFFLC
jgi:hypothetical protein